MRGTVTGNTALRRTFLGVGSGGLSLGTEDTAGYGAVDALGQNLFYPLLQRHLLIITKLIP